MNPKLQVVEDEQALAEAATAWIEHQVLVALTERGGCDILLAGGATPLPVYQRLSTSQAFFPERLRYYFGDERCVPPGHADNNYRIATEALFPEGIPPDVRVYRMRGEAEDLEKAALAYTESMPGTFDILLLGVGTDGHTASLFPGSPALQETEKRVVPTVSPIQPTHRLTITPRVIRETRNILVMASGHSKASILAQALNGIQDPNKLPIQLAFRGTWMIDQAAAAQIKP